MVRRTAVARAIDDVHLVAFLHQQRGPSGASIGTAHPVRALAAASMNQHDGVGMFYARRNLILHIHLLAIYHSAARNFGALNTHPEEAPLGEIDRRVSCGRGSSLRGEWGTGAQSA